jgi:hypothetical protein
MQSPHPSPEDTRQYAVPSRRDVLAAAGAALAGSAVSAGTATAAERTEGYFFVFAAPPAGSEDKAADRVFFISSAWLELFEVTDIYYRVGLNPKDVVTNIRRSKEKRGKKPTKFDALYSDQADTTAIAGATYVPPPQPGPSQTYLAMMISPENIPV